MSNVSMLKTKGLYTFQNFLSFIPEGALLDATNVVIDADGIINVRRGITEYGSISTIANQLLSYKNNTLAQYDNSLAYDNGSGEYIGYSASFVPVDPGLRVKGVEMNSNFYITTANGVMKVATNTNNLADATVTLAGGIAALDGSGILNYSSPGFFTGLSTVAYRIVFGTTDVNNNLILGSPSQQIVLYNYSTSSANVDLTFTIPSNITTNYFYQIYRTALTTSTTAALLAELNPGDEEQLVVENPITSADITAGTITYEDITPDSFRQSGAYLYTNPVTGNGILQSYAAPPVAKDIATYKGSMFYANTRTAQTLPINFLGLDGLTSGNISTISATNPAVVTSINPLPASLVTGGTVVIEDSGSPTVDGVQVITVTGANTFTIPVSGSGTTTNTASWFGSSITISNGTTTDTYYFVGRPTITDITFDTQANTADGSYFLIYSASNQVYYLVWFDKSGSTVPNVVPGTVPIRVPINETFSQQLITFSTPPTTGSITFGYSIVGTATISSTQGASDLQTALQALSGLSEVTVSGGYDSGFTVTFTGVSDSAALLTVNSTSLETGSATVTTTIAQTVAYNAAVAPGDYITNAVYNAVFNATNDFILTENDPNLLFTTANSGTSSLATAGGVTFTATYDYTTLTWTGSTSLVLNNSVRLSNTGGALPTGYSSGTDYYVISSTTNTFQLSMTINGAAVAANTDNGTGTQTVSFGVPIDAFSISLSQSGIGANASENYVLLSTYISSAQAIASTSQSLVSIINETSSGIIDAYYISGSSDVPGLMQFTANTFTTTPFTIISNNATTGAMFYPNITTVQTSTNDIRPNRVFFSVFQQPESVPIVNYLDIGPQDKEILRIVPLRDSLFVFKQDAIYRITGDVAPNFSVILFDNSVHLNAPDSAAVLNNQIYGFTDGGIATVSETGVGIISRPIENYIKSISSSNYVNFSTASFGIGYETERSYYIWTVTNESDTYATQCFRYNTFTQCWTRWDKAQTCGVVNFYDNKLYLGNPTNNYIEVERKNFDRTDYADGEINLQVPANAMLSPTTMKLSNLNQLSIGDALIQTQYVTINQFNSLLLKLDLDPRIGLNPGDFDTSYYANLALSPGENLTNAMTALVAELNADPGTSHGYSFNGSSDFATIQSQFNLIVAQLNADPILYFKNYVSSSGTVDFEITINDIDTLHGYVTVDYIPAYIIGPIVAFEGIQTSVIWAPQQGGDPALLKHFFQSTIIFQGSNFRGGSLGFASDLSPSFESLDFLIGDSGTWGGTYWGNNNWGGSGTSIPFRTFIPKQKQRCRWILTQFIHSDAFYNPSILGMSLEFNVSSDRAYRG